MRSNHNEISVFFSPLSSVFHFHFFNKQRRQKDENDIEAFLLV
jgi:hypothetical protein